MGDKIRGRVSGKARLAVHATVAGVAFPLTDLAC